MLSFVFSYFQFEKDPSSAQKNVQEALEKNEGDCIIIGALLDKLGFMKAEYAAKNDAEKAALKKACLISHITYTELTISFDLRSLMRTKLAEKP